MGLLIILAILVFLIACFVAWAEEWERGLAFFMALVMGGMVAALILVAVNAIGYAVTAKVTESKYSQPLASLNDGTGIQGQIYGGLFLTRGYIEDTQHYSYYVRNENGSFNLQKRPADASTIWQDTTPETARVEITDKVTTCQPNFWRLCGGEPTVEFVHADFHVPAGSIGNEYKLDAQ